MTLDLSKYAVQEGSEGGQELDLSQYAMPEERGMLQGAGRKTARLAGQRAIGMVERATMPYNLAVSGAQMLARNPPLKTARAQEEANPELAAKIQAKQPKFMQELEQKFRGSLEEQEAYEQKEGIIPDWVKEQNWDTGSLLEKGFEFAGVDMKPEDLAEHAVRWSGFVSKPEKLLKGGADLLSNPQKLIAQGRQFLPKTKELARGLGAGLGMELAAENDLGPMGTLAVTVLGDIIGGGAHRVGKGAVEFGKAPVKTTKSLLAKGAAMLTPKDKLLTQRELIQSFRDAGIQADIGTITDSPLLKWMQARVAQSGLVGKELEAFKIKLKDDIVSQYRQIANNVGEARFQGIHEAGQMTQDTLKTIRDADLGEIRDLYKASTAAAAQGQVLPTKLGNTVQQLEASLRPGSLKSGEQNAVLKYLDDLKKDIYDENGRVKATNVQDLINNKIALHDIIDYEIQGGTKQLLKQVAKDLDSSIKEYGVQDKQFAKDYAAANKRFGEHAKTFRNKRIGQLLKSQDPSTILTKMNTVEGIRDLGKALNMSPEGRAMFKELKRFKLDDIMVKNMEDSLTGQLKMGKFTNILEKGKNKEIVRELIGPAAFRRLNRLQHLTGKIAETAQRFWNSSQSGTVAADAAVMVKVMKDFGNLLGGNPWPLMKTGALIGAGRRVARLMADPAFLQDVEEAVMARNNVPRLKGIFRKMGQRIAEPIIGKPMAEKAFSQKAPGQLALSRSPSPQGLPSAGTSFQGPPSSGAISNVTASGVRTARIQVPPSAVSKGPTMPGVTLSIGSIDPSNNKIITQSLDNPQQLLQRANELKKPLIKEIKNITKDIPGASLYGVRVKDAPSLGLKLGRGAKPEQVSDYIGGRITVKNPKALKKVMERIEDKGPIEIDDFLRMGKGKWRYRALHAQVPIDGMSAEIQVVPKQVAKVQPANHKIYKKWQNVPPEEIVRRQKEYDADIAKSNKSYRRAFAKFLHS